MVTIFTAYTESDTLNFATINMLTPNALLKRFPVTKKAHLEVMLYSLPQAAHCLFVFVFVFCIRNSSHLECIARPMGLHYNHHLSPLTVS